MFIFDNSIYSSLPGAPIIWEGAVETTTAKLIIECARKTAIGKHACSMSQKPQDHLIRTRYPQLQLFSHATTPPDIVSLTRTSRLFGAVWVLRLSRSHTSVARYIEHQPREREHSCALVTVTWAAQVAYVKKSITCQQSELFNTHQETLKQKAACTIDDVIRLIYWHNLRTLKHIQTITEYNLLGGSGIYFAPNLAFFHRSRHALYWLRSKLNNLSGRTVRSRIIGILDENEQKRL